MVNPRDFLGLRSILDQHRVALSPSGQLLAYVVRDPGQVQATGDDSASAYAGSEVWVTDTESHETWVPLQGGRSWSPCWSPDGTKLALCSDSEGATHVYVWHAATGDLQRVSDEVIWQSSLYDINRLWLDDGRICVPLPVTRPEQTNDVEEETELSSSDNRCTAEVLYCPRQDKPGAQAPSAPLADLAIIDISTGDVQRFALGLPQAKLYPSPDGQYIAVQTVDGPERLGAFRFRGSIYVVDPSSAGSPSVIAKDLLMVSIGRIRHHPVWSPGGDKLAFIHENRVAVWSAGGATRAVTPDSGVELKEHFLLWSPDGAALLLRSSKGWLLLGLDGQDRHLAVPSARNVRGILRRFPDDCFWSRDGMSCVAWTRDDTTMRHGFWQVPLDGDRPQQLVEDNRAFYASPAWELGGSMADISAGGERVVFAAESTVSPNELWVADASFSKLKQVTKINPRLPQLPLGTEKLIAWVDGVDRQQRGMILAPPHEPGERLPVVISIYPRPGAPDSSKFRTWSLQTASAILPPQLLVANGYAVFVPDLDPQGKDFVAALHVDVLLAVRAALAEGLFDPDRMAIMGHSFGGYAVNCLVTQTNLFKAAVSCAGVGDLSTQFGASFVEDGRIDAYGCQHVATGQLGIGLPWDNPLGYLTNSPLFHLDRVQTPLLLIGGADDPLFQPQEMLVGLELLDKPVQCVRYRHEGHVPSEWSLPNQEDVAERILNWLSTHLGVAQAERTSQTGGITNGLPTSGVSV
jgi:dipeptidyl aminopeptidase/acylaminoacyl peptidase